MPKFISHLEQSRREAEQIEERCRKAAGANGGAFGVMTGGGATLSSLDSQSRQRTSDSKDQQGHYRGQVYISVRPIAERIGGQPIRIAKLTKSKSKRNRSVETDQYILPEFVKSLVARGYGGSDGQLEVIDQHPILDALHDHNPMTPGWTAQHLKYFTVCNLQITGYAYWWMPKLKGQIRILAMPSQWISPVHTDKELFSKWLIRPDGATEGTPVDRSEVAPFWLPDPSNPTAGIGPLAACANEVLVNEFVTQAQKRAFQLGVHPSAIIRMGQVKLENGRVVSPRAKKWQIEQVVEAIAGRYAGMANFGKPMVIDRMIESIDAYGNTPNEMDFGMNADKAQARVEQAFGTNAWVAGASGLGSRAEAAVADSQFCYQTVNPKIEMLSQVMTQCVVPLFDSSGQYVLFIEPARPNDDEMQQKEWDSLAKWCRVEINEDRARMRLPPVPWGNAVVVPNGYSIVPVAQLANGYVVTRTQGPQSAEVDTGDDANTVTETPALPSPDEQNEEEAEGDEAPKGNRPQSIKRKQLTSRHVKVFDDAFYDGLVDTWLKVHASQEQTMTEAVEKFLIEQADDVASKLEAAYGSEAKSHELRYKATALAMAESAFEPSAWVSKFRSAVKPAFTYAVVAGATHELAAFGDYKTVPLPDDAPETAKGRRVSSKADGFDINFEFGVDLPQDVLAGINKAVDDALGKDYWADIQETTKDNLESALKDALEAGEDMRSIVKRVKEDVFEGDVGKSRAETIARSEVTGALNAGQQEARIYLHEQGVVEGKEWFATFDGRTRLTHENANGETVGVHELFTVGGYPAKYPGDPELPAKERVRCRCIASSVTVFTKRTRSPMATKAVLCRGCEVHGMKAS